MFPAQSVYQLPVSYDATRHSLYTFSEFVPPEFPFYIKVRLTELTYSVLHCTHPLTHRSLSQVNGQDSRGFDFQRTSRTAITAIRPVSPVVTMQAVTHGFFSEDAVLRCQVLSDIPFSVQWTRDGRRLGDRYYFSSSSNVTWTVFAVSSVHEGRYACNATNAAGYEEAATYLDVKGEGRDLTEQSEAVMH